MAHQCGVAACIDEGWVCPEHKTYQLCICECMSLFHGRIDEPYPRNKPHTKIELMGLTPSIVAQHLNWKACRDPFPAPMARVTHARAESLRKVKQGISHFMPNESVAWMDGKPGHNVMAASNVFVSLVAV